MLCSFVSLRNGPWVPDWGQLDITFVAFRLVLLRIGDLHQGHVCQSEAGGKDRTEVTALPSYRGGQGCWGVFLKRDFQPGPGDYLK